MKTLSKVLSMLIVVVMCLSLFGASAYATGVPTVDGAAPSVPIVNNNVSDGPEIGDNYLNVIDYNNQVSGSESDDKIPSVDQNIDQTQAGTPADTTKPKVEGTDKEETSPDMSQRSSAAMIWKRGSGRYSSLNAALSDTTYASSDIELLDNATFDASCSIGQNVTINLNGKTITLGNNYLAISGATVTLTGNGTVAHSNAIASVTNNGTLVINNGTYGEPSFTTSNGGKVVINGGTFTADPTGLPGTTVNGTFTNNNGTWTLTAAAEKIASINGKGSWDSVQDAVTNAGNGDTIVINTADVRNIDAGAVTVSNKNLTFDVNDETVNFSGGLTLNNSNVTITGYEIQGNVTVSNGNLNLNTQKAATIWANGNAGLTVNGSTVNTVALNTATLNMSNGTIGSLTTKGNDVLNVSGGNINSFTKDGGSVNRAITGGTWNITGADNISHFKNCLADGRSWNANGDIYTVNGSGSTTNPGGSTTTPSQGGYALSTNAYTKGSNSSVYIAKGTNAPYVTSVWYGTSSTVPAAKLSISYTSGNNIYLSNSSLDSMPTGTYYIFAAYNNDANASSAGRLTIYGRGTEIPSYGGSLQVGTRYENDWYQGEDALQFYVNPFPGSGKDWTNMKVYIDDREVGNLDYYDYHNGYFYISTSKLESLGSGTHWLTVENIQTGETGSCSFYVGATLKARDTNKHVTGSSKDLKFVCSEPISRVWVGDKELDNYDSYDYYTLSRDGKTLTLTARFLNNRTAGNTYNLTVETVNGERVSTTFKILTTAQASSSPKTGDNSNLALWISALVMSGAAAAVILPNVKRKEIEG